jgi:zinc transport system substrate-binding protein
VAKEIEPESEGEGKERVMRVLERIAVCALFVLMLAQSAFAVDRVPVFVSIVPQKYFVQQIGKDLVDVQVMVQPGASPATYEPKPRQMAALAKAKVYFAIGVPFEGVWLMKIAAANPKMKVAHTDHGIEKIPMAAHYHHDEEGEHHKELEHHKEGEDAHEDHRHEDGGLDPHIWLSPPLVKVQARTILSALQEIDPSHRTVYETNYNQFVARIDRLDDELKTTFAGEHRPQFIVFHPAWGYFADAYGLEQVPIEIEGKNPKPAQLKELIEHAKEKGIKVIFVQPQFSTRSAKLVAKEIGGQVAFADPLAADWMANLRQVADRFKAALK